MEPLKAAVVGCGGHAQAHLEMIGRKPRLRLVGLAELDAARRARAQHTLHLCEAIRRGHREKLEAAPAE